MGFWSTLFGGKKEENKSEEAVETPQENTEAQGENASEGGGTEGQAQ